MNGLMSDFNYENDLMEYTSHSEHKQDLIRGIVSDMRYSLNQKQITELNRVLVNRLEFVEILNKEVPYEKDIEKENQRLIDLFLDAKKLEGRSLKTLDYYRGTIKRMLKFVDKPILLISTDDLRKWLLSCGDQMKPSSVNNLKRNISSFFQWLENEEYILKSPVKRIGNIKVEKQVKKPFTITEVEKLRMACDTLRLRAMVEFLLSSGVRLTELVQLNINDIDMQDRSCIVFGKGAKQREVFFNERTAIHLKKYLESRTDKNPALWVTENCPHKRLLASGVGTDIRALGIRAGVTNVHPHRFRRTMASYAVGHGMKIEQVRVLLGHESIETTQLYAIANNEDIKHAHKKYLS